MKTTGEWIFGMGLALICGLAGVAHADAADSAETNLAITIHVHNYAGLAPKTLVEAEEVATEIFRKAGIEIRWDETVLSARNDRENSANLPAVTPTDVQLSIFPRKMSDRLGLPSNVMGLAPGTGIDRRIVYVFDSNVEILFWNLLSAHTSGRLGRPVSKAQILGHAIAHEIGHVLLNLPAHSEHGIMSGDCGLAGMRDVVDGLLLFTSEQAEILRADARRRNRQQGTLEVN